MTWGIIKRRNMKFYRYMRTEHVKLIKGSMKFFEFVKASFATVSKSSEANKSSDVINIVRINNAPYIRLYCDFEPRVNLHKFPSAKSKDKKVKVSNKKKRYPTQAHIIVNNTKLNALLENHDNIIVVRNGLPSFERFYDFIVSKGYRDNDVVAVGNVVVINMVYDPKYYEELAEKRAALGAKAVAAYEEEVRERIMVREYHKVRKAGHGFKKGAWRKAVIERIVIKARFKREVPEEVKVLSVILRDAKELLLVGGAVIDIISGREIKDYDIEVYGMKFKEIYDQLMYYRMMYPRLGISVPNLVGKAFGIIKVKIGAIDFDLSIPRRENKVGVGHKGFEVELNENLTPKEAAVRRDLTINSMYFDIRTGKIIDPFNGWDDLKRGIIRATNDKTFAEDPLRVLRVMQLLPRKGKYVEPRTMNLCRSLINSFPELPKERIFEEFKKLMLKADKPSLGIDFLRRSGWLKWFPEINNLINTQQNSEGSLYNHTLLVLNNAAKLRKKIPEEWRLAYMFAMLLHATGKSAERFMMRITDNKDIIKKVAMIVKYYKRPRELMLNNAKESEWARLHININLNILAWAELADYAGSPGRTVKNLTETTIKCLEYAKKFGNKIEPLVMGKDLISIGLKPGKQFGSILKEAFEMQLEGATKEQILDSIKRRYLK